MTFYVISDMGVHCLFRSQLRFREACTYVQSREKIYCGLSGRSRRIFSQIARHAKGLDMCTENGKFKEHFFRDITYKRFLLLDFHVAVNVTHVMFAMMTMKVITR